jgi:hypothetical protein
MALRVERRTNESVRCKTDRNGSLPADREPK